MHKKNLYPFYSLFDHTPIAAAILHVDKFKLEMANPQMLELWGRPPAVIGVPLLDFLPELAEQSYPDYLKQVCHTGELHEEKGARVLLTRQGKNERVYIDYSYTPIFGESNKVTGILVMANDICELELNRLAVKQSSHDLRSLVLSAPVAMCIYRGAHFKIEVVNGHMLDLWQDVQRMNLSALNHVFHNGISYSLTEGNINYTYTPLGPGITIEAGVCVTAVRR